MTSRPKINLSKSYKKNKINNLLCTLKLFEMDGYAQQF